ncbi:MAG: glycosyltransferase [Candidatus Hodarchaeales archaeon]|jgi:dolichol-phosphate mannosyltransferase
MNEIESTSQLTIIIPTLNESSNINQIITRLLTLFPQVFIIVADDGSIDGTVDIVQDWNQQNPRVQLLDRKHESIKGLTISLVDALRITSTEYFMVIDCDFQHPPERITDGLGLLASGRFLLIIGTRTKIEGWSYKRKIISWGATTLGKFSLLLRRRPRPTDIMSGFFGGKTQFVNQLINEHPKSISPKGYKLLFDLLKVIPRDTSIGEFSYTFQARLAGESKIGMKQILTYFRSLF